MDENLENLIVQAQSGDTYAFGEIYKVFLPRVYRFVYYLVYDQDLAEDITQNAFIKAWQAINTYSEKRGTFQSFLFIIAKNLFIDYTRKKKVVPLDQIAEIPIDAKLEDSVAAKEDAILLQQMLAALDESERSLVILRYFEDLSFAEVAQVVGKREGAVRVKVHRALQKMKALEKNNG